MAHYLIPTWVMHRRIKPITNHFRYPIFLLRFNLSELEQNHTGVSRLLLGWNRWRPISIHAKDYGPRDGSSLLQWARQLSKENGINDAQDFQLQTLPRLFGYAFNPICLWYGYNAHQKIVCIIAEVNNTFGEHHVYFLPLSHTDVSLYQNPHRLAAEKLMHVSPFCEIKGHYQFHFFDNEKISQSHIDYFDSRHNDGLVIVTKMSGKKQKLDNASLLRHLFKQPLMTLGVIFRIHWQALKLWFKKVPFHRQAIPQRPKHSQANPIDDL